MTNPQGTLTMQPHGIRGAISVTLVNKEPTTQGKHTTQGTRGDGKDLEARTDGGKASKVKARRPGPRRKGAESREGKAQRALIESVKSVESVD